MDIVLGGRYTDFEGRTYSVLGLVGSLVKVIYSDGATALLPRSEHLRVLREVDKQLAIDRRHRRHVAYVGDFEVDMFTAGFLAARGYLYAAMPIEHERTFVEDHVRTTGQRPDEEHYCLRKPSDAYEAWNALSTYIECPYNDELEFGELELIEQPSGRWRVCSNRLFWALLLLGFTLGSRQNIDLIRSRLTSGHDEFERGVQAGEQR